VEKTELREKATEKQGKTETGRGLRSTLEQA